MNRDRLLRHLKALIGFDTQNPPRRINKDSLLFEYMRTALGPLFKISSVDHGKGRVSFLAVRGKPRFLFNVHIDTVPALQGSQFPPLEMHLHKDRVYGRGACDIKGAAACLLTVAQTTTEPMALLFTSDEEGGEGCCINRFIELEGCLPFEMVVVAEPTECTIETLHRGYLSIKGHFTGESGHSSERRSLEQNALHRMSLWAAAAISEARSADELGLRSCFNIGTMGGGVKSNVIADHADVHWSARLLPGQDNDAFLKKMLHLESANHAEWQVPFSGPPLPSADTEPLNPSDYPWLQGIKEGEGLDFWTEASLFSQAGTPALVFGPGNIEQAHTVDEWVSLQQLDEAMGWYRKMVGWHD